MTFPSFRNSEMVKVARLDNNENFLPLSYVGTKPTSFSYEKNHLTDYATMETHIMLVHV